MPVNISFPNALRIAFLLLLIRSETVHGQDCANTKHPGSFNLFKVNYIVDGKVKDLDTNFIINIYSRDSLICVVHPFSRLVETVDPKVQFQRFSSLIRVPVLKTDSFSDLSAEIEIGTEKIRWNANEWKWQDSIKFCDSHGLYIYKYTKLKKFPQAPDRVPWRFRHELKAPKKANFPFIVVGWKLEEFEIEMQLIKWKNG